MRFTKLHGQGNAFACVDCRAVDVDNPAEVARRMSDAKLGIGCDGLILVRPSPEADVRVDMFNADGSRMSMCGNGVRCVGRFALDEGLAAGRTIYPRQPAEALAAQLGETSPALLEREVVQVLRRTVRALAQDGVGELEVCVLTVGTVAGIRTLYCYAGSGGVSMVTADLGPASLRLAQMNCTLAGETAVERPVTVAGRDYRLTCVSLGNLHAVVFADDLEQVDVEAQGRAIECCPLFPDRVNVHFVQVLSESHVRLRSWERGSGATRACGTGACAATVAGVATRRTGSRCVVDHPGGRQWVDAGETVFLTGAVESVCRGEWRP